MARYATPAQLIQRHRVTTIAQLASDDGRNDSRIDLLDNANVGTALDDASGEIEASLLVGNRYTTDDLDGLTGNAAAYLQRICCDLAMSFLYDRNPVHNVDEYERYHKIAEAHLDRLRTGENIFNLTSQLSASLPTIGGLTSTGYTNLNSLPDRTRRFYPPRESRLPRDRG